jgi:hypothetical protein
MRMPMMTKLAALDYNEGGASQEDDKDEAFSAKTGLSLEHRDFFFRSRRAFSLCRM